MTIRLITIKSVLPICGGRCGKNKIDNMQFGALVSLFTMIPVLNLVILPVAVCGATAMWCDRYRDLYVRNNRDVNPRVVDPLQHLF